eukprot:TRINITY_DN1046_c0_g1_i1.p1 TRINITY_DN1046_c0_g1~~TRINITY_DN1046_c0_g1_i1.p1  ORF type:complete len:1449 (-),score=365.07 TRINITY_DN1046_c0_g1_i1:146-4492(-)
MPLISRALISALFLSVRAVRLADEGEKSAPGSLVSDDGAAAASDSIEDESAQVLKQRRKSSATASSSLDHAAVAKESKQETEPVVDKAVNVPVPLEAELTEESSPATYQALDDDVLRDPYINDDSPDPLPASMKPEAESMKAPAPLADELTEETAELTDEDELSERWGGKPKSKKPMMVQHPGANDMEEDEPMPEPTEDSSELSERWGGMPKSKKPMTVQPSGANDMEEDEPMFMDDFAPEPTEGSSEAKSNGPQSMSMDDFTPGGPDPNEDSAPMLKSSSEREIQGESNELPFDISTDDDDVSAQTESTDKKKPKQFADPLVEAMCEEYGQAGSDGQHWNYILPAYWQCDHPACGGRQQSPINIAENDVETYGAKDSGEDDNGPEEKGLAGRMKSKTFSGQVHNSGHGLQVSHNFGSFQHPSGETYKGLQFHIHFPSEHAIDGELRACELHMVHQKEGSSGTDGLLVVGVLFKEGKADPLLEKMGLPEGAPTGEAKLPIQDVNLGRDFASVLTGSFFHYVGSLTTPPCAETVLWFVMKKALTTSRAQIEAFRKIPDLQGQNNNRPLQPQNGRQVYKDSFTGCAVEGKEYTGTWNYALPVCWQYLEDNQACSGSNQSPINIKSKEAEAGRGAPGLLAKMTKVKNAKGAKVKNTGKGLQIDVPTDGGSWETFGGVQYGSDKYRWLQCHIHFPAEHSVDGILHDAELHCVHQKVDSAGVDDLLVVGFFFKIGDESPFLKKWGLPDKAPKEKGDSIKFPGAFNWGKELGAALKKDFFRYEGSLTTPPCAETVKWFVATHIYQVSRAQVAAFAGLFHDFQTDRPVQLRNGRVIVMNQMEVENSPVGLIGEEVDFEAGCAEEGYSPASDDEKPFWNYLYADCWKVPFPDCGGRQQSPIDINSKGPFSEEGNGTFDLLAMAKYVDTESTMVNNGHGLQVNPKPGKFGSLQMDGKTYNAAQYHIHCPSEHTVDGAFYTCEVHIVHAAADTEGYQDLLVVGLMYKLAEEGEKQVSDHAIKIFVDGLKETQQGGEHAQGEVKLKKPVNLNNFKQMKNGFYRYDGSLTTPPCTETVKWFVLTDVASISLNDAVTLSEGIQYPHVNNRPVQPKNGRGIWKNALPGCYFNRGTEQDGTLWDYLLPQCWSKTGSPAAYPKCTGKKQSPIDIQDELIQQRGKDRIKLSHGSATGQCQNTGHGLQVAYEEGHVMFADEKYNTLQFHIHMPSEHAIDGVLSAAEVHVVHRKQGSRDLNDLLVTGVLYDLGAESPWLNDVFPPIGGGSCSETKTIKLDDELSAAAVDGFYAYSGSLTTPPCDETVQWVLFKKKQSISRGQVDRFLDIFMKPSNNRPVQPLFGRVIVDSLEKPQGGKGGKKKKAGKGPDEPDEDVDEGTKGKKDSGKGSTNKKAGKGPEEPDADADEGTKGKKDSGKDLGKDSGKDGKDKGSPGKKLPGAAKRQRS